MRIIIYGINYAPELTGIGKYTSEMAKWFVQSGHSVSVITAMPYYPNWEISQKYRGKWWHSEILDGVKVCRCPIYVPKKVNSKKRILHEISYLSATFPFWLKSMFQKKFDMVIAIAPPFHVGLLPLIYSKLRGVPFIMHIQDLQIDIAKDFGMIRNKHLLRFMFALERFIFRNSSAITTISDGMLNKVLTKNISKSKCFMLPNWVDENDVKPLSKGQSLREEFEIAQNDKVILYAGNLGKKQGLENIIEAAIYFKEHPHIKFVIVGNGACKSELQQMAFKSGLSNIIFFPLQPYEKLSALLAIADLHLVLQMKSASDLVMPSKLTSILAAGGCSLVTAVPGSSLHNLISKFNLGILLEPENPKALAMGIETALSANLTIYKRNARLYAEQYLSKTSIMNCWERELLLITMGKQLLAIERIAGNRFSKFTELFNKQFKMPVQQSIIDPFNSTEAVPIMNIEEVGSLRDSLFVSDGLSTESN